MQSDYLTTSRTEKRNIRFLRPVPVFVWAVTGLHVALLLLGSVFQPLLRVPDEPFHADMILAVSQEPGWPPIRGRVLGPEIEISSRLLRQNPIVASDAIPRSPSQTSDNEEPCEGLPLPTCRFRPELRDFSDWDVEGRVNRMTQHPPLYYVAVASVSTGVQTLFPPAFDLAFDQELWLYRVVTLLMVAPLPILTFLLAREITEERSVQHAAVALTVFITGLHLRNGPMINNDNLLLLLGALFLVGLIRIAKGDTGFRAAVLTGLVVGLSLLTKGFALFLVPTLAIAYLLAYLRARSRGLRPPLQSGLISLSMAGVVGGWWWLRNLLLYGRLQPGGAGLSEPAGPSFEPDVLDWFREAAETNIRTFFGGYGVPRSPTDPLLFGTLIAFVAFGVAAGLLLAGGKRRLLWLLLLPMLLVAVGLMLNSYRLYRETGLVKGENGRYFYFLLPGLFVILANGYVLATNRLRLLRKRRSVGRFVPLAFVIAAITIQVYGLVRKLNIEWGPPDTPLATSWEALVAWSPLPQPWVTGLLVISVLLAVGTLVLGVRLALEYDEAPPTDTRSACV